MTLDHVQLFEGISDESIDAMKISEVAAKVAAGEDIVTAGYEYLDDQTVITTKDLTGKATADIVAIAAAVIGAIAGILGMVLEECEADGKKAWGRGFFNACFKFITPIGMADG